MEAAWAGQATPASDLDPITRVRVRPVVAAPGETLPALTKYSQIFNMCIL